MQVRCTSSLGSASVESASPLESRLPGLQVQSRSRTTFNECGQQHSAATSRRYSSFAMRPGGTLHPDSVQAATLQDGPGRLTVTDVPGGGSTGGVRKHNMEAVFARSRDDKHETAWHPEQAQRHGAVTGRTSIAVADTHTSLGMAASTGHHVPGRAHQEPMGDPPKRSGTVLHARLHSVAHVPLRCVCYRHSAAVRPRQARATVTAQRADVRSRQQGLDEVPAQLPKLSKTAMQARAKLKQQLVFEWRHCSQVPLRLPPPPQVCTNTAGRLQRHALHAGQCWAVHSSSTSQCWTQPACVHDDNGTGGPHLGGKVHSSTCRYWQLRRMSRRLAHSSSQEVPHSGCIRHRTVLRPLPSLTLHGTSARALQRSSLHSSYIHSSLRLR